MEHIESARLVAFTVGLAEALQDGDRDSVAALGQPVTSIQGLECLIVVDARGQALLHVLRRDDSYEIIEEPLDTSELWMARELLEAGDPKGLPKRGLGYHRTDQRRYYLTAVPVEWEGEIAGVVVVGTSLDTLLAYFKRLSLADVIVYDSDGHASNSTFIEQPADIDPELYDEILHSTGYTLGENLNIQGRLYRLARGPLRVGNERMAVFGVAMPWNFIVQARADSRNTYAVLFITATALVIVVGYLISQYITNPIKQLVSASQAVADGRLDQRTGIAGADEIGMLATTFDEMTSRLEERTHALEETVGRMRAILSSMDDGVMLEDLEGNFIPLNATANELLEEMATNFHLGPLRESSSGDLEEISGLQASPWLVDRRRFGIGQKVISIHSTVVRTDDGEGLGTVIVMRDVTDEVERIRMEARVSQLEELDRQKNEFISVASHELRSPLTSAKTFVQNLLDDVYGPLSDDQTSRLETVLERIDDEIIMVNTLLDFSWLETQSRPIVRKPINIATIIHGIVDEFRPRAKDKDIALSIESLEAETVLIDKRMTWRVMSNLLDNALKFTPSGGQVTLSVQNKDEFIEIQVIDTGIGIPEDQLERIFDRFYQVDSSTTREFGGMGLGLAIAKEIVEKHGGNIRAESQPGAGSVFHLTLPKAPA
ncbi:MAG: hypothetical protein DRJ03_13215 [Chloroflexi bacterium]|nr:MAG: hypothetical protein DRI81_09005 [Chloroflexota bacterium]RLC84841.1 MAG: hypothetical protein DRJ03_13215 [Chloroflexota bacterium]